MRTPAEPSTATYRAEGGGTAEFRVRAATVAGVGHRLSADENQDSYAWAHEGSRLAVAVADGLGSVPGSGAAARLAATAAVAAALDPSRESPEEAAEAAVSAAGAALAGTGGGATTLVLAVIDRSDGDRSDGDVVTALARIGDSTAILVQPGPDAPGWQELFEPAAGDDGEVGVATPALSGTSPAVPGREEELPVERAAVALSEGDVLALVTDGIAGPWRDGPTTVAPAMVDGLRSHPSALELAQLADFSRQGCHDDRTMALVWLAGE